jgi:hypothetical protein
MSTYDITYTRKSGNKIYYEIHTYVGDKIRKYECVLGQLQNFGEHLVIHTYTMCNLETSEAFVVHGNECKKYFGHLISLLINKPQGLETIGC